jgi:cysteine-rich repeat protein
LSGNPFFPPPQGSFAAVTDNTAPGAHVLYQDVALAAGMTHTLSLQLAYRNYASFFTAGVMLDMYAVPSQHARVDVVDPAAPALSLVPSAVLATIFRTQPGDALARPWFPLAFDLTPFAGRTVRLRLAVVHNQGWFNVGVDDVHIVSAAMLQTREVGAPTATRAAATSNSMRAAACGDGAVDAGEACDDGNALDDDGCSAACADTAAAVHASATLAPGDTLTSDPSGASAAQPVRVAVRSPVGGLVTLDVALPVTQTLPLGFRALSQEIAIGAEPAAALDPLVLGFALDASRVPAVLDETVVHAFADGVRVDDCVGAPGTASPDPCVAERTRLSDGDVELIVLASAAGVWNLGVLEYGSLPPLCPPIPDDCRAPVVSGASRLKLRHKTTVLPNDRNELSWQWAKGAATSVAELADPTGADTYALCLYDANGLRAHAVVPFGGLCNGKQCWTAKPNGFVYKDVTRATAGMAQLILQSGAKDGSAKITVRAKGPGFPLPDLATLASPVVVQLRKASGLCFGARYSFPPARQHDAAGFDDQAD